MNRKIIIIFSMLFLVVIVTGLLCINANQNAYAQEYDNLLERYDNDDDFKLMVQIGMAVLGLAVLLSVIGAFLGFNQSVIWSFIGGFAATNIIELLLNKYFGVSFGFYSFFAAFSIGLGCALHVQMRS